MLRCYLLTITVRTSRPNVPEVTTVGVVSAGSVSLGKFSIVDEIFVTNKRFC